ncbi:MULTISPECIES: hypothetical protein [Delftia]|uniref:Uncharacterized protein n=1 Tax=Delftia lacustris TaxID=558537 RepID=A0A7T2YUM4_9BURK|nr:MULTISPECIES: hypothetical protein [Delftia]EPD39684.1 hypothetical protein HMPREF9702_04040 [Delftia acidovorans CCUG 15835]QPS82430.1 hypothetical protein I6G47_04950 [Delftia lacustris]
MPTVQIKFPHNAPVPSTLTLVEGNRLRVKIEAVAKTYKLGARIDAPSILAAQPPVHNARADSWQFDFVAQQPGLTKLSIVAVQGSGLSVMPAAITVQVEKSISLPAESTTEGMLARLFLAENTSPALGGSSWRIEDIRISMQWMRRVIENRLKSPNPGDFMARGATSEKDIVMANDRGSVQFHGFNLYPTLPSEMAGNLQKYLQNANNGLHPQRKAYLDFVQAAIDIAQAPVPPDPTSTGLFGWKTTEAPQPGPEFREHKTLSGNTFYTHTRLRKKD